MTDPISRHDERMSAYAAGIEAGWKEGFACGIVVAFVIWVLLGVLVWIVWLSIR